MGLLAEFVLLDEAWPEATRVLDRARIGRRREDDLERIGDLQAAIAAAPAGTIADAAVKFRRLQAQLEDAYVDDSARLMLASPLDVVEQAAAERRG